ncbi:hypothetical protein [Roseinatronobacter sp.]
MPKHADFASRHQDVIAGAMAAQAAIDGKRNRDLRYVASQPGTKGKIKADSLPTRLLAMMVPGKVYTARAMADTMGMNRVKIGHALSGMASRGRIENLGRNSAGHNLYRLWP